MTLTFKIYDNDKINKFTPSALQRTEKEIYSGDWVCG